MKSLPYKTQPPRTPFPRDHAPPQAEGRFGYRKYKPCLRWEFGFTCAFCLVHECDLSRVQTRNLGRWWIEHFELASASPERVNDYENCYYCCDMCNAARASHPARTESGNLLDPCSVSWNSHFELEDCVLRCSPADADAVYTERIYDLNALDKVRFRTIRKSHYERYWTLLLNFMAILRRLARVYAKTLEQEVLNEMRTLQGSLRDFWEDMVEQYPAIPLSAPDRCACDLSMPYLLPPGLDEQCIEL